MSSESSINSQSHKPNEIAIQIEDLDEKSKNQVDEESRNKITSEENNNTSRPGTSLEIETENHTNDNRVPSNVSELLETEGILQSLEDLNKQLIKEQQDLLKEYTTPQCLVVVSKHEIAVGSDHGTIHVSPEIPEDPNYPPPPYSFHRIPEQQVYIQHDIRYQDPAPDYFQHYDDGFHSTRLRNKFVTKVYGILTSQLLITFGFVMMCVYVVPVRNFVKTRTTLYMISMITLFVLLILLACFINLRRSFPTNFILLLLFTLAFAYSIGAAACFYSEKAVMVSVGSTAAIVATISFLAWLNFFDITAWGFVLFLAFVLILLFGIAASIIFWIIGGSETLKMIFASLVVLFFTIYLLYDTQKLLGGGRISLSPEEYILGALSLYVDIMLIFNYLMLLCVRR